MSIIIFGDSFSFPEGDAATNRVHTYAKGFHENNSAVHVICFANDYDSLEVGFITGIRFYHPFGQRKRNRYLIVRRWQKFIKYFKKSVTYMNRWFNISIRILLYKGIRIK